MRLLCIPQVAANELVSESDFGITLWLMEEIRKIEPSFFYLWVRARDQNVPRAWPNSEIFAEQMHLTFYQQMTAVTGRLFELFNRVDGSYPVDAVFTSRAGLVPALMVGLATRPSFPVPCVITESHVYAPGTPSHNEVTEVDAAARALGYALGIGMYWSEWEKAAALNCVEMWLSPAAVKRAEENSVVITKTFDFDGAPRKPRQNGRKRLLLAGRLNTSKNWRDVLKAYGTVMAARQDTEVWVHGGTGAFGKLIPADARWHRTSEKLPYAEYLKVMADADVSAYASVDEGVSGSVLEQLDQGIVMAMPKLLWVDKLFEPEEYPFKYGSFTELPRLLDYMLDHVEECQAALVPVRRLIREKYGIASGQIEPVIAMVKEWNERNAIEPIFRVKESADMLMRPEGIPLATVLKASGALNTPPGQRTVFSKYAGWLAVQPLDDYESAEPYLRAVGTVGTPVGTVGSA